MCTDQLAQRNHRSYLTPLLRFGQVERRSPLSHFSTNASRGGDRLATTINLSSRLFRDYKFRFERVTRLRGGDSRGCLMKNVYSLLVSQPRTDCAFKHVYGDIGRA